MRPVRAEAEAARDLAREGARLAADLCGKVAVRDKGGGLGPVTEADLRVEKLLLDGLARAYPGDPVLAEETARQVALPAPRLWCVDPIDGTFEYAQAIPEWAVQVGIVVDGEPAAGAIGLPTGAVIWGWRGGGAFVDGTRVDLEPLDDPAAATAVHSRRHLSRKLKHALDRLGVAGRVPAGGVGFKAALILERRAHLYLHTGGGTTWWDSVAPAALLLAAGGTATDAAGGPLDYSADTRHGKGLMFAVPELGAAVVDTLKRKQPPDDAGG